MFHSSEFLLDPAPSVAEHLDPRRVFAETDGKINPGPPAQRFMKPPLSRYIALAQRRTNGAYVASRAIIEKSTALAPCFVLAHCGWMFACFAIFRKTTICSRTNLPNSSGFIGTDVMPILRNCSRTSFPCRIAFTRAFSFWTVAGGVPARVHMPNHSDRL